MEKTPTTKGPEARASKILNGIVVSDKMQKTVVVEVDRYVMHPKYKKYITKTKRYKAHDEANQFKIGDKVSIREVKPISKDKHFEVITD